MPRVPEKKTVAVPGSSSVNYIGGALEDVGPAGSSAASASGYHKITRADTAWASAYRFAQAPY